MANPVPAEELPRLSDFVAETMGLDFPPSRWPDLQRGIAAAIKELGHGSSSEFVSRLLRGMVHPKQWNVLACHLTVGETYFLREPRTFEFLARNVVPEVLTRRRGRDQRLRIWSAACCTGEEAYSIAITLRGAIPDIEHWQIAVLATDINSQFLHKAAKGIFGPWSFRDVPAGFKESHFCPLAGGHWEIRPEIKRMVKFAPHNLVEGAPAAVDHEVGEMDIIFCRNALMYFTPAQAHKVVAGFHRMQVNGGWLIVGSGELSQISGSPYVQENVNGVIHFRRKNGSASVGVETPCDQKIVEHSENSHLSLEPQFKLAETPSSQRFPQDKEENEKRKPLQDRIDAYHDAKQLANEGKLSQALDCCEQWLARDLLNPAGHYLRAVILQELKLTDQAIGSLRGALYLDPDFVLAHIALGNIARARGRRREAEKHLTNAKKLLAAYPPDHIVPESEGITAGQLRVMLDQSGTCRAVSREMEAVP